MSRIIDLTLTYDENIPNFSRERSREIGRDGWLAHDLHIYSHAGTHMDAPVHFNATPKSIDEWEPERFISTCHVVRLYGCAPRKRITVADLGETGRKAGPGESILIATGWHRFLGRPEYRDQLPGISLELAGWMVEKRINMVLVEPPSVADVNDREEVTAIHLKLLKGDIIIVEGICNTEEIKKDTIKILAFPLKIRDGDGAPARVLAIED